MMADPISSEMSSAVPEEKVAKRPHSDEAELSVQAGDSSSNAVASGSKSRNAGPGAAARNGKPQNNKEDANALLQQQLRDRLTKMQANQLVLLELPSSNIKPVTLTPGTTINLGKFGSFPADQLIGMPYGLTFEIEDGSGGDSEAGQSSGSKGKGKGKEKQKHGSLRVVAASAMSELEETDATNEFINDDHASQALTHVEIQALRDAGKTGEEIVKLVTESNSSFTQKTVFAQDKFIKRKAQKHLRLFTPLVPSAYNVCTWFFNKHPEKTRNMRADALAQMLSMAEVRSGGRYLVVDGIGGLLTGAMLERMGSDGRIISIHDADSPPALETAAAFNLPQALVEKIVRTLNWAQTEESWTSLEGQLDGDQASQPQYHKAKSRQRKKRKLVDALEGARRDFFDGEFDALLVASEYEPYSIFSRLVPRLAGSANIVAHNSFLQPLVDARGRMRLRPEYLGESITEPWLRRYQVLPGRTHPEMNTSATGGYLLHAIRVLVEPGP